MALSATLPEPPQTQTEDPNSQPIWSSFAGLMDSLEVGLRDRLAAAKFAAADPRNRRDPRLQQFADQALKDATASFRAYGVDPDDVAADKVDAWTGTQWAIVCADDALFDPDHPATPVYPYVGRWVTVASAEAAVAQQATNAH